MKEVLINLRIKYRNPADRVVCLLHDVTDGDSPDKVKCTAYTSDPLVPSDHEQGMDLEAYKKHAMVDFFNVLGEILRDRFLHHDKSVNASVQVQSPEPFSAINILKTNSDAT